MKAPSIDTSPDCSTDAALQSTAVCRRATLTRYETRKRQYAITASVSLDGDLRFPWVGTAHHAR
jgi:hypothetical protein